jgi:hypothetical protein
MVAAYVMMTTHVMVTSHVMVTTYFHMVPRLRMIGSIPLLLLRLQLRGQGNVTINIIIIIIGKNTISFMQGIYTYISETSPAPKECNVAAILSLLFMAPKLPVPALALMYFYISTFRSMCAVPNMAVFCSSLTSLLPGTVLTHFLNDFEMVPFALIITGITLVFKFHIRYISMVRSLYFKIFSASF